MGILHYLRSMDDLPALVTRPPWVNPATNFVTAFPAAISASSRVGACPQATSSSRFRAVHIIQWQRQPR